MPETGGAPASSTTDDPPQEPLPTALDEGLTCFICLDEEAEAGDPLRTGLCACRSLGLHLSCLEDLANSQAAFRRPVEERLTCHLCKGRYCVKHEMVKLPHDRPKTCKEFAQRVVAPLVFNFVVGLLVVTALVGFFYLLSRPVDVITAVILASVLGFCCLGVVANVVCNRLRRRFCPARPRAAAAVPWKPPNGKAVRLALATRTEVPLWSAALADAESIAVPVPPMAAEAPAAATAPAPEAPAAAMTEP